MNSTCSGFESWTEATPFLYVDSEILGLVTVKILQEAAKLTLKGYESEYYHTHTRHPNHPKHNAWFSTTPSLTVTNHRAYMKMGEAIAKKFLMLSLSDNDVAVIRNPSWARQQERAGARTVSRLRTESTSVCCRSASILPKRSEAA